MSAQRPRVSLGSGIGAAFALSLAGAAVLAALAPLMGTGAALRVVIALVSLAYVLYVVAVSGERVGRITTVAGCGAVAALVWLGDLPLAHYVLAHAGLVWLVRSLYHYSGLVPALVDLGLTSLGLAFAAWAAARGGGAWLALWCFLLAQAFHALIPPSIARHTPIEAASDAAFARAQRAAEAAVRRLSSPDRP